MEKLTKGCINKYFSLGGKSDCEVNDIVQVLHFKEIEGKVQGQIYTVTLSDSFQKFERFFLPKRLGGIIKVGDLVKIRLLNKCVSKGKIFFKVSKYEVIGYCETILGEPKSFKFEISNFNEDNVNEQNKNDYTKKTNLNLHDNDNDDEKKNLIIDKNKSSSNLLNNTNNNNLDNSNQQNQISVNLEKGIPTRSTHMSLNSLTSYTKDLVILVRVIKKTEKKTFNSNFKNRSFEGCVFNFNILDTEGTEMQVNCFNKIADKLYPVIKIGHVYEIIGGYIKANDHKYNHTKSDYQIALNEDSIINPVLDNFSIAELSINLVKLDSLLELKNYDYIDFIALVIHANDKVSINSKYGEMNIRKLVVADDTQYKVDFTLWKDHADTGINVGDVILVKKAKIGEYSGRNMSASDDTQILINPKDKSLADKVNTLKNILEIDNMENYNIKNNKETLNNNISNKKNDLTSFKYTNSIGGNFENFKTYIDLKYEEKNKKKDDVTYSTLYEAFNEDDKFHKVKVYLTQFKNSEKNIYAGCPRCMKKLIESDNMFRCNSCNEILKVPYYYLSFSIRVKDSTSDQWVDVFGTVAEKILKISGNEYRTAVINKNQDILNNICEDIEFKSYIITVKCRYLVFNNVKKKKLNCYSIEILDKKSEAKRIIKNMENTN